MRYAIEYFLLLVIIAAISIMVPKACRAVCETMASQPLCWAGGPSVTLCAKPEKTWNGEWEWLVGSQLFATTPTNTITLPCLGTAELIVKVRTKGSPSAYTMKPIHCADPWDTNQSGTLTTADITRLQLIVSKKCSLGRNP